MIKYNYNLLLLRKVSKVVDLTFVIEYANKNDDYYIICDCKTTFIVSKVGDFKNRGGKYF